MRCGARGRPAGALVGGGGFRGVPRSAGGSASAERSRAKAATLPQRSICATIASFCSRFHVRRRPASPQHLGTTRRRQAHPRPDVQSARKNAMLHGSKRLNQSADSVRWGPDSAYLVSAVPLLWARWQTARWKHSTTVPGAVRKGQGDRQAFCALCCCAYIPGLPRERWADHRCDCGACA